MPKAYANRVWMTTATTGTGTITLGSAKAGYLTPAEAGVADADTVTYCIIDGNDFELGTGTYTSSGTTLSRDTVTVSKISGTAGTTKLTLSGSAEVFFTNDQDETAFLDRANTFTAGQAISVNSSGAALTVTQTGSGIALRVEDEASPDSTCFVVTASGDVGVGTDSPGTKLSIYDASAVNFSIGTSSILLDASAGGVGGQFGTVTNHPFYFKSNNTIRGGFLAGGDFQVLSDDAGAAAGPVFEFFRDSSSPAASDNIGLFAFTGRDSAANGQYYASFQGVIVDPTSTSENGALVIQITGAGTHAERARFTGEGNLTLTGNAIYYQAEQAEVGTTYTLALTDANKMVTLANGSAITLTVPTNASIPFPIGTRIDIAQFGAGQVSVTSSATIRSEGGKLKLRGQYSAATLWKKATDEWLLAGDIVA
jgi:hypothetical protein